LNEKAYSWTQIATQINLTAKSQLLVDLGAAPMPVEDAAPQLQDFIEKSLTVRPRDWNLIVHISKNAIDDDQTGTLNQRVRSAGRNFQRHLNNLVFTYLDAGDGSTYGLCYDGLSFFNGSHKDKGAAYSTTQDNSDAVTLSLDNFETELVKAQGFRDDQGEFTDYTYDLIVTSPTLARTAYQITSNPEAYDTNYREKNPYTQGIKSLIHPKMSTTAWIVVASGEATKPLGVVMREQPNLQDAWFDATQPEGGWYYFKFFARYDIVYLDWRLAIMGNT
jgi:hypothetical protein